MTIIEQVKTFVESGCSFAETGRRLGLSRHAVKNIYRRKIRPYKPYQTTQKPNTIPSSQATQEAIQNARIMRSQKADLLELRALTQKRALVEELRDAIRSSTVAKMTTPPLLDLHPGKARRGVGVLLLSDIHLGQLTPARLSSGYAYDVERTKQQFASLFQQVKAALERHHWEQLLILDLGDTVDGDDMRASQHRFIGPLVVEQVALYGRLLAQFVSSLLPYAPTIHIERVPGNHARTSQRPGLAGLSELDPADSYDWLGGEFAREILRESIDQGRVTILNHDTFYGVVEVCGLHILFEHGSSLRGGGGNLGIPVAALQRALSGYRELEGEIDIYCLGHFHQPYVLSSYYNTLIVGNGSFPPTSPFVLSTKKSAIRPSQTLLALEKGAGVVQISHLWLDSGRINREKVCR